MRAVVWIFLLTLSGSAWAEATGRIVGPDGAAIRGAEVCELVEGSAEQCVTSDAAGFYRIAKPAPATLLVRAKGYVHKTIDAAPLAGPVQLERAATLEVTVIDADTKKPVPSGRVMLDLPSGRRIGEFVPFNTRGVRISTLPPGELFVRVDADGYESSGPVPVMLVSGENQAVTVPLTKSVGTPR